MFPEMCVKTQHVAFKEKIVPKRLLSPVVVAFLLPQFTRFSADRQKPIASIALQPYALDGIPEILTEKRVFAQKAPVLIFSQ